MAQQNNDFGALLPQILAAIVNVAFKGTPRDFYKQGMLPEESAGYDALRASPKNWSPSEARAMATNPSGRLGDPTFDWGKLNVTPSPDVAAALKAFEKLQLGGKNYVGQQPKQKGK